MNQGLWGLRLPWHDLLLSYLLNMQRHKRFAVFQKSKNIYKKQGTVLLKTVYGGVFGPQMPRASYTVCRVGCFAIAILHQSINL